MINNTYLFSLSCARRFCRFWRDTFHFIVHGVVFKCERVIAECLGCFNSILKKEICVSHSVRVRSIGLRSNILDTDSSRSVITDNKKTNILLFSDGSARRKLWSRHNY